VVVDDREAIAMRGRDFWKMSGSGNDFVFFNAMHEPAGALETVAAIGALCERRTGVGADGVVFLEPHPRHVFSMRYFNRDGSLAEMCGNAALCSTRLAVELGIVGEGEFTFETSSGPVSARFTNGLPEIDMVPVTDLAAHVETELAPGERRIGYTRVGVPHLVVEVRDVTLVDVIGRGRALRRLPGLRDGANVNFVSRLSGDHWAIRTYERGVEEETLACGTGAVGSAAMLNAWGSTGQEVVFVTRSGRSLSARVPDPEGKRPPALRGEGRIVFSGSLGDIDLRP
jgi:diaminopimelate epimerase